MTSNKAPNLEYGLACLDLNGQLPLATMNPQDYPSSTMDREPPLPPYPSSPLPSKIFHDSNIAVHTYSVPRASSLGHPASFKHIDYQTPQTPIASVLPRPASQSVSGSCCLSSLTRDTSSLAFTSASPKTPGSDGPSHPSTTYTAQPPAVVAPACC